MFIIFSFSYYIYYVLLEVWKLVVVLYAVVVLLEVDRDVSSLIDCLPSKNVVI